MIRTLSKSVYALLVRTVRSASPYSQSPSALRSPMAAPEPEAKPEAVAPSPSREPPLEPELDAPAVAGSQELQPWEQHAAVINLPRYDYRASGSLLLRSHSGFLITCPIKREKSATKEAISILEEYIGHANCHVSEQAEPCDVKNAVKKRKLCSGTSENSEEAVTDGNSSSVSETTVAYNRRGIDETEMKPQKNSIEGSNHQSLMDREQCFKVVAAAVKSVAENSVVDLKSPEVAVLIEMLPVSGVPLGSSVAGVSVLPAELFTTKPRLCVRSLASDAKATKK
ncbi:hypothetical protein BAE44_0013594 [Dichanthelium oligosanthes]|uniref:THUMP domain-containing protein n=1 Tax=Dichanthelium oligosanthes TaxID=888268 RepID=A0A1E5VJY3_9POAL|nr:hypothetical protein BAE44_0013594 [Dichanthelium oligosanthes]